eukprot:GHVN01065818.1.p1 GENE.GHVN01065818.1~~GHVN01065818.1.p1  ORF type:complete len:623 (+),score=28.38 GHVN01065818.1:299-2167(+)
MDPPRGTQHSGRFSEWGSTTWRSHQHNQRNPKSFYQESYGGVLGQPYTARPGTDRTVQVGHHVLNEIWKNAALEQVGVSPHATEPHTSANSCPNGAMRSLEPGFSGTDSSSGNCRDLENNTYDDPVVGGELGALKARGMEWQSYPTVSVVPTPMRWGYNMNSMHTCMTPLFSHPVTRSSEDTSHGAVREGVHSNSPPRQSQGPPEDEEEEVICHDFDLPSLWDALEEASTYGIEVPSMDSAGFVSQVVYIPYLSALYISPRSPARPPATSTESDIHYTHPGGQPSVNSCTNSEGALEPVMAPIASVTSERVEPNDPVLDPLVFFDTKPPYVRPPFSLMIRALLENATDGLRGETPDVDVPNYTPTQIELFKANTSALDEDSWMAIYWHPVQTEMRRSSGSDVAPTFLICYSLAGAAVKKALLGSQRPSSTHTPLPSLWSGPCSVLRRKMESITCIYKEMCPVMLRLPDEPRLVTFAVIPCYADGSLWRLDPSDSDEITARYLKENNRCLVHWLREKKLHMPDLEWITHRQRKGKRWSQRPPITAFHPPPRNQLGSPGVNLGIVGKTNFVNPRHHGFRGRAQGFNSSEGSRHHRHNRPLERELDSNHHRQKPESRRRPSWAHL